MLSTAYCVVRAASGMVSPSQISQSANQQIGKSAWQTCEFADLLIR
jgi:hypothetical protein